MGTTKIEWCDRVWNPMTGCSPISEGCKNCYARRMANRLRGRCGYPKDDPFRVTFHRDRLDEPLRCRKPSRFFVCSMGDLFHELVPIKAFSDIMNRILKCPRHIFVFLTKRPQRMFYLLGKQAPDWQQALPYEYKIPLTNLWLGVSVENQRTADERIPILLKIPAAKRFVSVEPMLEEVNLHAIKEMENLWHDVLGGETIRGKIAGFASVGTGIKLDWVICGGETGPNARSIHPDWARFLRDQCGVAGIPFFFKQMARKYAIPKDLMIREFPK